jgi:hypothetical protein
MPGPRDRVWRGTPAPPHGRAFWLLSRGTCALVAGTQLADLSARLPAGAGQSGRQGVPGRVASLLYEGGVAPGRQLPVTSGPQPLCALCGIPPVTARPGGCCRAWLNLEAPAKTLRGASGSATSSPDELFGKDSLLAAPPAEVVPHHQQVGDVDSCIAVHVGANGRRGSALAQVVPDE